MFLNQNLLRVEIFLVVVLRYKNVIHACPFLFSSLTRKYVDSILKICHKKEVFCCENIVSIIEGKKHAAEKQLPGRWQQKKNEKERKKEKKSIRIPVLVLSSCRRVLANN